MSIILIFIWILAAFTIMAFLEKTIEGPYAWGKKTYGWKQPLLKRVSLTEYHLTFWLFIGMLGLLPLVINGFSFRSLGILISAFALGFIWEDFLYFIVNPYFGLKKFKPSKATWYPWIKIGKFELPVIYIIGIMIAIASWYFLWRI